MVISINMITEIMQHIPKNIYILPYWPKLYYEGDGNHSSPVIYWISSGGVQTNPWETVNPSSTDSLLDEPAISEGTQSTGSFIYYFFL